MADVEVSYRGQIIRSMSASGQEVLHTEGKYCDDDITIDYTQPGGGGANLQTKSVSYTPDETGISDTILPDPGYDGLDEVDVTVDAIPDTYVGSAVPQRDSTSLTSTGQVVHVPAGYYDSDASRGVNNGTAGTPTASKGAVNNHSVDVTPSVTNTTGWITGGTQTGTPVTVSASELVSGDLPINANGSNIDVTNYETVSVNVSGGGTPAYIYDDTDEYTFAEAASGTPASIYPDFIGSAWTDTSASKRRMWYCYSADNGAQTNQFLFASIAISTANPPNSVVTGRRTSSNQTNVATGIGSAITVKFTAGCTVKIVQLKNPLLDSFT